MSVIGGGGEAKSWVGRAEVEMLEFWPRSGSHSDGCRNRHSTFMRPDSQKFQYLEGIKGGQVDYVPRTFEGRPAQWNPDTHCQTFVLADGKVGEGERVAAFADGVHNLLALRSERMLPKRDAIEPFDAIVRR